MQKKTKILIVIALMMIAGSNFLPLWKISLDAPQYPEGLSMQIWTNKISGDLKTINGLNHYIGMKAIELQSIPELKIMPVILAVIIIAGMIAVILNSRKLFVIFILAYILAGISGGVDFYFWEYDYGHNLNPDAAIKVPGMSYQPPLIGEKQILNFYASSYPDTGGILLIAAGIILVSLLILEYRNFKNEKKNLVDGADKFIISRVQQNARTC